MKKTTIPWVDKNRPGFIKKNEGRITIEITPLDAENLLIALDKYLQTPSIRGSWGPMESGGNWWYQYDTRKARQIGYLIRKTYNAISINNKFS